MANLGLVDPGSVTLEWIEARPLRRLRCVGVWALVDSPNNLFQVRLSPDGRAISTSGVDGVPLGGSTHLHVSQL